jgi:aminoglycoside phosphotransferase (APT) family kinase protein
MITANRGAVTEALERWNARRRKIFYPKTDLDFDLGALRQRKQELGHTDLSKLGSVLDEEIASAEFLSSAGTFHALFRLQTSSGRYFLKLSPEEPAVGFAVESWAMTQLRALGLRNLSVPAFSISSDALGAPFLVIEEAKGQPLNRFENVETQAVPSPLLSEFGKFLARVHTVEGKGAGLLDVGAVDGRPRGLHAGWSDYLMLRLEAHLDVCEKIGAIKNERGEIERKFADAESLFKKAPLRWLHGDPGHHNVFSDGQQITAVIDWEDSLCGDPIFDVAFWGTFCRDEMREEFLNGYQTIQKLPADFELRYWLYYLRTAISKTVHRHHFGAKDRPGRPPASQRIQKALSKLQKM